MLSEIGRAKLREQRQHDRTVVRYYSLPDKIRALEFERDSLERDASLIRAGIPRLT